MAATLSPSNTGSTASTGGSVQRRFLLFFPLEVRELPELLEPGINLRALQGPEPVHTEFFAAIASHHRPVDHRPTQFPAVNVADIASPDAIKTTLLPAITSPEFKKLVNDVLPGFEHHLAAVFDASGTSSSTVAWISVSVVGINDAPIASDGLTVGLEHFMDL